MGYKGKKARIKSVHGWINGRTVVIKRVVSSKHILQTPAVDIQPIKSTAAKGDLQKLLVVSLKFGVHERS